MFLELAILALIVAGVFLCFVYCIVTGICPCSSTRKSRKAILASVSEMTEGVIYELGAGWGALSFPLAKQCKDAQIIAYELSPVPWLFMSFMRTLFRVKNVEIYRRDFLDVSLEDAQIIVCYLHPQALKKLEPKLKAELSPGATVISNTFELPTLMPTVIEKLEDFMCPEIFTYHPVKVKLRHDNILKISKK